MAKDSQIDNKEARMRKCNYQTPLTAENQNHNPNAKNILSNEKVSRVIISINLFSLSSK